MGVSSLYDNENQTLVAGLPWDCPSKLTKLEGVVGADLIRHRESFLPSSIQPLGTRQT